MSYTNIDQVRQHLSSPFPVGDEVENQPVRVDSNDYIGFYGGAVDANSVRVKTIRASGPTRKSILLSATGVAIDSSSIVPDSVVVASDSSLGDIHTENVDYVVDYQNGMIYLSDGDLAAGQTVSIWYVPFTHHVAGVDYQLNSDNGQVRALSGGEIDLHSTIRIDYAPLGIGFDDDLLGSAVAVGNSLVERAIDPDGQFGADAVLQSAATCLAMEWVCRSAASRWLSSGHGDDKAGVAWMKLAEQHRIRADELLAAFTPPRIGPADPVHS